ncbi:MAG: NADH:ubiquinone oxidoreductase subunit [Bacillales bacterium]|jgi:NADH-quinone oxidoreductase subunit M|nr:NADH:ubiquinone oxidoreductase subunit [Bacillales bacterium]
MDTIILNTLIFSPLLGIVLLFLWKTKNEISIKWVGVLSTVPSLVLSIYLFFATKFGEDLSRFSISYRWFRFGRNDIEELEKFFAVNFQLNVDSLAVVMLLLTTIISTMAAFSIFKINKNLKGFVSLFLVLETGMLGVFAAGNMILFFLFFEMTLISTFFLTGKWGYEQREKAAYRFLIYNGVGSALLLFVIMTLQARFGTTDISVLTNNLSNIGLELISPISSELRYVLLGAIILAFGIKLPSFPFHSWVLKMHTQAPTPVVMLHAGILLKIGAYGLIRFGLGMFPNEFKDFAPILAFIGVLNLLFGAFVAFIQTDFRFMIAYSSVSHMGFVLMGLGALNELGLEAVIFTVISHGLISAFMFYLIGILLDRTKTTELVEIGGLSQKAPVFSGFLLFGTMALLGLPGLSGFVSEFTSFLALFESQRLLAAIGTIAGILTAVFALSATLKITYGPIRVPDSNVVIEDLNWLEKIPLTVLTGLIVIMGLLPNLVGSEVQVVIHTLINRIWG